MLRIFFFSDKKTHRDLFNMKGRPEEVVSENNAGTHGDRRLHGFLQAPCRGGSKRRYFLRTYPSDARLAELNSECKVVAGLIRCNDDPAKSVPADILQGVSACTITPAGTLFAMIQIALLWNVGRSFCCQRAARSFYMRCPQGCL